MANVINDFDFDFGEDTTIQESYNAGNSSYKDLFDEKFTSFDPDKIVADGANHLKSGMFSQEVEETPELALGYKKNDTPLEPKRPGRFF